MARMHLESFFDAATWTLTHLVLDADKNECALIDTVWDYDPKSGRTSTTSIEAVMHRVAELGARVQWILETHLHADHLTASAVIHQRWGNSLAKGAKTAVGERVREVQKVFAKLFNVREDFPTDGSQFHHLFHDNENFNIGGLKARVLFTPGHTPACVAYIIEGASEQGEPQTAVFVGDTLFMPDYGTARCDFPGGSAGTLYQSVQKIYALPDDTMLYMCHDYLPENRPLKYACTLAEMRAHNIHINHKISEEEFVAMRHARDASLEMPTLILPSVQINMRAGHCPPAEDNGVAYLKIPINAL